MSALAAALRRDRWLVGAGLGVIAAIAWAYIIRDARRMAISGECALGMEMGGPDLNAWPVGTLLALFVMWAVMMVAMMLPSAAPMILTFASVARDRRRQQRPYVSAAVFVVGYVAIWCAFSALAALGQWWLHRHALLSPSMASTSALLGGTLLVAAGVFQFTPLKHSCLGRCRTPLEFIMTRWREGWWGAFTMGLEHGAFCTGCCWALMTLLFVAGVMNILWIAALTILVGLEKMFPRGAMLSAATGALLAAWGMWMLAHAFLHMAG